VGDLISIHARFDIAQETPSEIYYGTGQALPYPQCVVSPVGTGPQLIAYSPVERPTGFYEILQTDTNTLKTKLISSTQTITP
jgi:hypothetical protein